MIGYQDKTAININPSIPAENKVTDNDMNELKHAINDQLATGWFNAGQAYNITNYSYNSTNKTLTCSTNVDCTSFLNIGTKIKIEDNNIEKYGIIISISSSSFVLDFKNQTFENISPSASIIYSYYEGPENFPFNGYSVLYNNPTGDNGTITLLDSIINYNRIKIYFKTNDDFYGSIEVNENPNGKQATMFGIYAKSGETSMFIKSRTVTLSGTNISTYDNQYQECSISTGGNSMSNNNYVYITKVIGYK